VLLTKRIYLYRFMNKIILKKLLILICGLNLM